MMGGVKGTYTGNIAAVERLGIPSLSMQDGPQGFRATDRAGPPGSTTAWPSVLSAAASWDADLLSRWGQAMGKEFKMKRANVQLGPGIGLARVPVAGRNFEYLCGEDPALGSKLVGPLVRGIQSQGVIANAKHYVNNEIEERRDTVSADVDERTRFEIYYPVFQAAVDAGVLSVMCSYNRINDVHACQNPETLRHLKEVMGFNGWVMSDWLATHSTADSVLAGLDQELPLGLHYSAMKMNEAIEAGTINVTNIDEAVQRILTSMLAIGMFDADYYDGTEDPTNVVTSAEHSALAREIVAKGSVLVKNKEAILPLSDAVLPSIRRIAVIGDNSTIGGGGSGSVTPAYIVTHADGMREALAAIGGAAASIEVIYDDGEDIDAAVTLAKECEFVVVVVATTSSEGFDRDTLSLGQHQDDLVYAIANASTLLGRNNVVVSVITPAASLLPWLDQVPGAVLINWMPGQEVGNGFADVVFGKVNPSGRLPVTIPNKDNEVEFTKEQYPGTGFPRDAIYSEELLVGYRWYDFNSESPLLPFGFGLSYTTFNYSNMQAFVRDDSHPVPGGIVIERNDWVELVLQVDVTNTGKVAGDEVVQVYVQYPSTAQEPIYQLRNFAKVFLQAGQTSTITLTLTQRDLSIWDVEAQSWKLFHTTEDDAYVLYFGSSSRSLPVHTNVILAEPL